MKLPSQAFLQGVYALIIIGLCFTSAEVDCDACSRECTDADCESQKAECKGTATIFQEMSEDIDIICNDNVLIERRGLVREAKDMLVCKDFYPNWKINQPTFHFCEQQSVDNDDDRRCFVLSNQVKAIFLGDWQTAVAEDVAEHMTRSMELMELRSLWGSEAYDCLLSKELEAGNGFTVANALEQLARLRSDAVEACIQDSTKCPGDCPTVGAHMIDPASGILI
jgi:hypothetical protein